MATEKYYCIGITLRWVKGGVARGGWSATAEFRDGGHCDIRSTEGQIKTRYFGPLSEMVDLVKSEIDRFGIRWTEAPAIYYDTDGESPEYPPPHNWKSTLRKEATRLGWRTPY